jgi:hypothetical protein
MREHYRMTMPEPCYMFRTSDWGAERIKRVKVIKATAKTVVFEDDWMGKTIQQTERRETVNHGIFDTWQEAHAWLLARAENSLNDARRRLEQAQGLYGNIKGMKKPEYEDE